MHSTLFFYFLFLNLHLGHTDVQMSDILFQSTFSPLAYRTVLNLFLYINSSYLFYTLLRTPLYYCVNQKSSQGGSIKVYLILECDNMWCKIDISAIWEAKVNSLFLNIHLNNLYAVRRRPEFWEVYHRALQRWRTRVSVSPCRLSKKPGDNKAKKSKQVSQKYTASRLHEKGVLISIDDLQPNQWVAPPAGHRILFSLKLRPFVLPWDGELTVSRFESWSLVLSLFLLFSSQVQECYFWNFSVGGCRSFRS